MAAEMFVGEKQADNCQRGRSSFQDVPDEILLKVMVHVSGTSTNPADIIGLSLVCKRWRQVRDDPAVLREASRSALAVRASQWCPASLQYLRAAIDAGSLEAAYILGMILFYCVPEERSEGGRLLVRAGREGHAAALFAAAIISFNGSGWGRQSKDLKMGVALCARSAALGNVEAIRELGHCLLDGFGTKQDQVEGWRLLLQAHMIELLAESAGGCGQDECAGQCLEDLIDAKPCGHTNCNTCMAGECHGAGIATGCSEEAGLVNGTAATAADIKQKKVGGEFVPSTEFGTKRRCTTGSVASEESAEQAASAADTRPHGWRGWKLYGNNKPMSLEKQQAVLQELLQRSKARLSRVATACLITPPREPAPAQDGAAAAAGGSRNTHLQIAPGSLTVFSHAVAQRHQLIPPPAGGATGNSSSSATDSTTIFAMAPRPAPRSAAARAILADLERAPVPVMEPGSLASLTSIHQRAPPKSAAARAILAEIARSTGVGGSSTSSSLPAASGAQASNQTAAAGPSSSQSIGRHIARNAPMKLNRKSSLLMKSLSAAAPDGLLGAEDLVRIVQMLASGAVPNSPTKGLKSILTYLQTSSVKRAPHPANAFLVEWFGRTEQEGAPPARGTVAEGLQFCGRENCGKPETRPMEFWRCSCCWSARYCSRSCQLHDWRLRHSAECKPSGQFPHLRQQMAARQPPAQ